MKSACFGALLFLLISCKVNEAPKEIAKPAPADSLVTEPERMPLKEGFSFFKIEKDSNGTDILHTFNTRYFTHTAMMSDLPVSLLIEEKLERKTKREGRQCSEGRLEMTIYRVRNDSLISLQKIEAPALSYAFSGYSGRLFLTDVESCADALPVHGLYSLRRSEPLLIFYKSYNTLTLPATKEKRYVGFHPYRGAIKPVDNKDGQRLVGVLRYTDEEGNRSDFALRCSDSVLLQKLRARPPKLFFTVMRNGQTVRAADLELYPERGGKAVLIPDGFQIEINLARTADIEAVVVPVKMDRIDSEGIKIPDDRLQLEKLR